MAKFCTQCGVSNPAENAFCEGCGHAMGKPPDTGRDFSAKPATALEQPVAPRPPLSPRVVRIALASVASVVLVGGVGLYFALATPKATRSRLMEVSQAATTTRTTGDMRAELCLNNANYSGEAIVINPLDERTKSWLDALVVAGVYGAPTEVVTGSYFVQQGLKYQALPELAKWRNGRSLCLAKAVVLDDVIDIQPSERMPVADRAGAPELEVVSAKVVYKGVDVPDWMVKPEVQDAVQKRLSQWTLEDGKMTRAVLQRFSYHDGRWITGVELAQLAERMDRDTRASADGSDRKERNASVPQSSRGGGGIFDQITQIFSVNSHPLVGEWRIDRGDRASVKAMEEAGDDATQIVFTNDSTQFRGNTHKSRFDVDGNSVTVILDDGPDFKVTVLGKNAISIGNGLTQMKFKRQ